MKRIHKNINKMKEKITKRELLEVMKQIEGLSW